MTTYNTALIARARSMRKTMTPAEKHLWFNCLATLPCKFRKQRPFGHYIMDFYCPELKLVIEVDGDSHFSETAISHDQKRTLYLETLGLRVLRFTNHEVYTETDAIREIIAMAVCKEII